jgi:hypothetical protein
METVALKFFCTREVRGNYCIEFENTIYQDCIGLSKTFVVIFEKKSHAKKPKRAVKQRNGRKQQVRREVVQTCESKTCVFEAIVGRIAAK